MPPMPTGKILRRKRTSPTAIVGNEQIGPWIRKFEASQEQGRRKSAKTTATSNMDASSSSQLQAGAVSNAIAMKEKATFLSLPREVQSAIIKECSSQDLIALSLVSRHFHSLAAEHLYRQFHIVFPDDDDTSYDSTIDGLAGGLETFVTSDYDYVQFLREIWLDSLSGGSKGERAYRHYTAEVSCGKFMNTLLLLTLRKASKLEAFNWDIRVELSGQVYKALHQIPALKRVHIRLNPGGSSYAAPPPLPSKADALASSDKPDAPVVVGNVTFYSPKVGSTPGKDAAKTKAPSGPKTIAGFRNLETLEILDMDSLSYVDEIRLAIENSNGTLKKLKLGFAESLARQARKPPPSISSPDDSEPELDEFVNMAPPPPPPPIASTPDDGVLGSAKALIAAESKKLQEAVLGEVFGIAEPQATEESSAESAVKDGDDKKKEQFERMGSQFVVDLLQVSKKLMAATSGGQRTQSQKDALEMIEKAAKKYVEEKKEEEAEKAKKLSEEAEKSKDITEGEATEASPTVAADGADSSVATKDDAKSDDAEPVKEEAGLFDNIEKKPAKSSAATGDGENPEDIDIEAPDVVMDEKESDDQSLSVLPTNVAHESPENTSTEKTTVKHDSILAKLPEEQVAAGQVSPDQKQDVAEKDVNEVMAQLKEALDKRDIQKAIDCFSLWQAIQASSSATEKPADLDISQKAIGDYIRESRGLQLTDLSIYLIPIKASVLSKAVDLRCLKHISLLNVGPQTAFWLQMSKENAISPLPLHEIQTDNVTTAFLNFVGSLDKVTELFLLERKSNIPEYSFAPKTTVTSRHIRRLALKKHWGTLKRLVIRDERDRDFSWDANAKFIETLCLRGKALEELGISFNSTVVHTLLQYLPGLTNLYALHIISFRNDDTCHWVLREIRKFIVDCVAHHEDMCLEYIAHDLSVERIIRSEKPKPKAEKEEEDTSIPFNGTETSNQAKGKEVAAATPYSLGTLSPFPSLSTIVGGKGDDSSDEDEEDDEADGLVAGGGLRCKMQEAGKFYDTFGIKMWSKEVLGGRL